MWDEIFNWLSTNSNAIIVTIASITIGFLIYKLGSRQLKSLVKKGKIDESVAFNIRRILKIIIIFIVLSAILTQFAEALGLITSLFTLVGGTIFGFAAINTLGNAVAGLILMVSKPFVRGDRIDYNGRIAEVISIDFMYTKLKYLDNTNASVPNQTLMQTSIIDYGKGNEMIGRSVKITVDYDSDPDEIISFLIETVKNVDGVINNGEVGAVVSGLLDYAVEYACFYKINEVKKMAGIDARVRKAVLQGCQKNGIDLTMPALYKKV